MVCNHDVKAIIADFQLGPNENGLDVIGHLRQHLTFPENVCLLSAVKPKEIQRNAVNDNVKILSKPANPEDIKNFLLGCISPQAAE